MENTPTPPTVLSPATKRLVAVLVGLAFFLSLASAWRLGVHEPSSLTWDDHVYYSMAQSIVNQHCFAMDGRIATFWPPAYPVFLALISVVAGPGVWPIYFVQSVLYALALWLVFKIALAFTNDARLAITTLFLCVFWLPFYTGMTSQVMSEGLALPLGAIAFWFFIRANQGKSLWGWLLAGILFGLAGLTRPPLLVAGLAATAYVALRPRPSRPNVVASCVLAFGALLALTPWLVRGYVVTGGFVPISAQGPYNFYLGNSPQYYETGDVLMRWFDYHPYSKNLQMPSAAVNKVFMREGMDRIKENPVRATGFFIRKFTQLWLGDLGRPPVTSRFGKDRAIKGWGVPKQAVLCTPVFLMAVFGWFTLRRETRIWLRPLLWGIAAYTAAYVMLYTEMRYSFPVYPYLLMLAAAGLLRLLGRRAPRNATETIR